MNKVKQQLKTYLTSNLTAFIFAVTTAALPLLNGTRFAFLLPWVVGINVFIVVLFFVFLALDRLALRQLATRIEYTEVSLDWRINENGDFEGRYQYKLRNNSRLSVEFLPRERLIWFSKPERGIFKIIVSPEKNLDTRIIGGKNSIYQLLLSRVAAKHTYILTWDYAIDPPLQSGREIGYAIHVNTPGTERDAFTEAGTYAGIPAGIPIRKAKLSYSAPLSFRFNLLTPLLVVNDEGIRNFDEETLHAIPTLHAGGSIIQWEVSNLKAGLRYWFKYRLEKIQ